MKKGLILLVLFQLAALPAARAQWTSLSAGLPETDISSLAADPKDPAVIYAGSERRVYKTIDGGKSWKQVFGVRGGRDHRVQFLYVDPENPSAVYAATTRGIQNTQDAGKHWKPFYAGVGEAAKKVFCISVSPVPAKLWIGTAEGLFSIDLRGGSAVLVPGAPRKAVYSILADRGPGAAAFLTTDDGIYRSGDAGVHWERVLVHSKNTSEDSPAGDDAFDQFGIEELSTTAFLSNIIFVPGQDQWFAGTQNGILESPAAGNSWKPLETRDLVRRKINYLARSSRTFYAATNEGVFQWDRAAGVLREASEGLDSKEARILFYQDVTDTLLAGTKKGVFQWRHPEITLTIPAAAAAAGPAKNEILRRFENEPSIQEIQRAAIEYAEVHPRKIEEWRRAAARRAFLPTLSLNSSVNTNQNVDLDRGGTGDPDKFIIGPNERKYDWSAGVSWNLGDLIWNDDQTSIDTRSRLMVELRDDILNEVTHLYYERRRLELEMTMSPVRDLPIELEKEMRLEELTAGIDALTGGYFSKRLVEMKK